MDATLAFLQLFTFPPECHLLVRPPARVEAHGGGAKMLDWVVVFFALMSVASPCRPFHQLINRKLMSSGALTARASVLCTDVTSAVLSP